ncbi:MAG: GDSL-type esterase/lipase family protein [Patescibacteria group bacterium]
MFKTLLLLIIIIGVLWYFDYHTFWSRIKIGKQLAESSEPASFIVANPSKSMLIIGDSTGVGTGASSPETTLAGLLHRDYPKLNIDNKSDDGLKINEVRGVLDSVNDDYDIILIHAGGNDIVYFSPLQSIQHHMTELVREANFKSKEVIVITSGNVGFAPIWPYPLNKLYDTRSQKVLPLIQENVEREGGTFVSLLTTRENDPFKDALDTYYAEDGLHLSSEGYVVWYESLLDTLSKNNISLD